MLSILKMRMWLLRRRSLLVDELLMRMMLLRIKVASARVVVLMLMHLLLLLMQWWKTTPNIHRHRVRRGTGTSHVAASLSNVVVIALADVSHPDQEVRKPFFHRGPK